MITRAATGGWDDVDGCYCSLDTAQGILQPPRKKAKLDLSSIIIHGIHSKWEIFRYIVEKQLRFSYQSQVVLFCLLMSLPHADDEVRITRVSTILRVTAWLILGLLRSICRAFDTRIFNDSDLDRNWVKLVPPKKEMVQTYWHAHIS